MEFYISGYGRSAKMTAIDIKNSNLIPLDYEHLSIDLREIWEEYKDVEDKVKSVIVQMVTILENNGFSRTEAIEKIQRS